MGALFVARVSSGRCFARFARMVDLSWGNLFLRFEKWLPTHVKNFKRHYFTLALAFSPYNLSSVNEGFAELEIPNYI
jgi:hypothetical protein